MELVRSGTSWSGRERNCAFLNCPPTGESNSLTPRFANISAVTGLDFKDDARAIAVVDWDHDGDLDLWVRNRTAPRLRLMLNRTRQLEPTGRYVSLQLQGTTSNRDAVGARVELVHEASTATHRLVRTVRAGDAFLSQSSKLVHFGLPPDVRAIKEVTVDWPGGVREQFPGVSASGLYLLVQGSGKAIPQTTRAPVAIAPATAEPLPQSAAARVVLPGRVSVPAMELWTETQGKLQREVWQPTGEPTLMVLWSGSCPHCRQELTEYSQHASDFEQAGLRVLAVCLDSVAEPDSNSDSPPAPLDEGVAGFLAKIQFPYAVAQTTPGSLDRLRTFQNALFDRYPEFVVPLSLMLDADGNVVCIYRGSFPADTMLRDRALTELSDTELREIAVPLPGSWITKPATRSQFAEYVGKRMYEQSPEEGLRYFEIAMNREESADRREYLRQQIVQTYRSLARKAAAASDMAQAQRLLDEALQLDPDSPDTHADLATIALRTGDVAKAEVHLRTVLRLRPSDVEAQRRLESLRQTSPGDR
jgi:hypothetical protein